MQAIEMIEGMSYIDYGERLKLLRLPTLSYQRARGEMIIYYRFIVRFPIGLDFLFTFLLHLLLSWKSSLSISSSAISASTLSNHVFLGLPTVLLDSILHTFLHPVLITFSHHMSIPSQSTTSKESCDRLNSNQPSQFLICPSVFQ